MLTPRFSFVFSLLFVLSGIAVAQHGRPASGSPSSAVPPFSGGTTASPAAQSAIFISGKVVLDDGTELTEPAVIQTICRGRRHSETYSDVHGSFSFRFGDPTQGSAAAISDAGGEASSGPATAPMRNVPVSDGGMRNCLSISDKGPIPLRQQRPPS